MDIYTKIYRDILFPFYETVLRGRKTFDYLKEFEANQWRSEEELKRIQWQKMLKLIAYAYETIPYYKKVFDSTGFHPSQLKTRDDARRIPILTKRDIQENVDSMLSEKFRNAKLQNSWTGGSTGEPLRFKYDHTTYEMRVASTARIDRWAGWDFGEKELYVWGVRPTNDPWFVRTKKQLHHALLRRKTINSYLFSEKTFPYCVKEYNAFKPTVIIAYISSLYNFAEYIKRNNIACHSPKGIIATAEQLFPHQRKLIEEVFKAPVFNRYGSREFMNIGMECEKHEGLHLNVDNLYIEILKDGQPAKPGETGELVITDINNYSMPFIRYKIGDLAIATDEKCSCGRGMSIIKGLAGRLFDTLRTKDGRCVTGLFFTHLMHEFKGVGQFQVVQRTLDDLTVRIVKNQRYQESDTQHIQKEINKLMGESIRINFEFVAEIPKQSSGKTRITISEVPYDFNNN